MLKYVYSTVYCFLNWHEIIIFNKRFYANVFIFTVHFTYISLLNCKKKYWKIFTFQ